VAGRGHVLLLLVAVAVGAVLLTGPAVPHDPGGAAGAVPPDRGGVAGAVPHDDGGVTAAGGLDPTLAPASAAAATGTAQRFAAEWSAPGPDWQQRVAELSTPALASALAGADAPWPSPRLAQVPAVLLLSTPQWTRIAVATDRGEIVLDLILVDDRWLVAGVDWRPG
jgi:hypothetical protein